MAGQAPRRLPSLMIVTLAIGVALAQAGCLVTSGSRVEEQGVRISPATLNEIELGRTTESWLLAVLGEPTARTPVEGCPDQQVLRYDYVRSEASGGTILFLFAGGSRHSTSSRAYFEITNGVVTRYWME